MAFGCIGCQSAASIVATAHVRPAKLSIKYIFPANVSTCLEINDSVFLLDSERHMRTALSSRTRVWNRSLSDKPEQWSSVNQESQRGQRPIGEWMRKRTGRVNRRYVLQVLTSCQIRREEKKMRRMECQLKGESGYPKVLEPSRTLTIRCPEFSIRMGVDNPFCPWFGSSSLQPTIQGKRGECFMSNREPGSNKASCDSEWNLKIWTNAIKAKFQKRKQPWITRHPENDSKRTLGFYHGGPRLELREIKHVAIWIVSSVESKISLYAWREVMGRKNQQVSAKWVSCHALAMSNRSRSEVIIHISQPFWTTQSTISIWWVKHMFSGVELWGKPEIFNMLR